MTSEELPQKLTYYAEEGVSVFVIIDDLKRDFVTVQSSLDQFDRATEWADLIKCLQRLAKVMTHDHIIVFIFHLTHCRC